MGNRFGGHIASPAIDASSLFAVSVYVPIGALLVLCAIEYPKFSGDSGAVLRAHLIMNAAALYLTLWILLPLIVAWMNSETSTAPDQKVTESDRVFLRQIARQTWRFFDTFVGPHTNWLPPDNYQAQIRIEVAPRTSPTNIGLWYLVLLAAQDMGYLTIDDALRSSHRNQQNAGRIGAFRGPFPELVRHLHRKGAVPALRQHGGQRQFTRSSMDIFGRSGRKIRGAGTGFQRPARH